MKRVETYIGMQVYEWLFSAQAQNDMVALGKLSAALLGTNALANGLACAPTIPASMTVQIGAGELYQMAPLEATVCGTLPADTTHQILKQGIRLDAFTTATFATPVTSGQSINYLIEAQYQDNDISIDPTTGDSPVVLQFFNADNPQQPWSGPNNSGSTSNTFRDGAIAYQVKAGVAANTGSQVTPTPDTGWVGLWVVTVPFGATSLVAGNISQFPGAPILPSSFLQSLVTGNLTYGIDNGSANTVQASFPVPVATLTDGMAVWVKIKAANTGATTFTPNPGTVSAAPVVGLNQSALQGGELVANGRALFVWRQDITSWVLTMCSGGAQQVAPATASNQAVTLGQVAGVVGDRRNLVMNMTTASATGTLTADEIIVESALGGLRYCLSNFSKTINLATTGAGGMDTGTAPASSFVAIYAIYNPTTQTAALLATKESGVALPNVYGAGNMPSGFTASALLALWPTNASGQFVIGYQQDRAFWNSTLVQVILTSTQQSTLTPLNINTAVPSNAKTCSGVAVIQSSTASALQAAVAGSTSGQGQQNVAGGPLTVLNGYFNNVPILANARLLSFLATVSAGTMSLSISVGSYTI